MADDPDFSKGASPPSSVYDNSASGLGLSPAYLANIRATAQSAASAAGGSTSGPSASRPLPGDAVNQFFYDTTTEILWFSNGTTWLQCPNAALYAGEGAGGVLSGSYPNPGFAVDMATQAELNAVQAASVNDGDPAGGVLSGSYPNPTFAVDMATQAELDAAVAGGAAANMDAGNKVWSATGDPDSTILVDVRVNFNKTFASPPIVVTEAVTFGAAPGMDVHNTDTTGFSAFFRPSTDGSGNASGNFNWIAVRV